MGLGWRVFLGVVVLQAFLIGVLLPPSFVGPSGLVGAVLVLALPMALGYWISRLAEAEYKELLARQDALRALPNIAERAQAVQEAMDQAVALVDELQDEVKVRQRLLAEIQREVVDYRTTAAISKSEAQSVARVVDALQARARRWSFWGGAVLNVAVAFIFSVLGVNWESWREPLFRWLRLG